MDGPRVMICTAVGREGINLRHARIFFHFDLPFSPIDVEQRIGRIHRYGPQNTAQISVSIGVESGQRWQPTAEKPF